VQNSNNYSRPLLTDNEQQLYNYLSEISRIKHALSLVRELRKSGQLYAVASFALEAKMCGRLLELNNSIQVISEAMA